MARSIQQIKNELASIEEAVNHTAVELYDRNGKYLSLLGKLAGKQLVLCAYQLCTQVYPDAFLNLSYSSREKLQQKLRDLGKSLEESLTDSLIYPIKEQTSQESLNVNTALRELNIVEQMLEGLSDSEINDDNDDDEDLDDDDDEDLDDDESALNEAEDELDFDPESLLTESELDTELDRLDTNETASAEMTDLTNEEEIITSSEDPREAISKIADPEALWRWQKQVEKVIKKGLEKISTQANQSLQENKILSDRVPTRIIDLAARSEEAASVVSSVSNFPNILNLAIEIENKDKLKKTGIIQVTILRLRLSEIEFAEPTLSLERNHIRGLIARIEQLRQQYRKKQRECKIAEAEAAWRSSWYEQ
jgi:hypothetical protein